MPKCRFCKAYGKACDMIKVPLGHFCDFECARRHGEAKRDQKRVKDTKKAEKSLRVAHRKQKEALKTKSQWMKEAQAAFNRFIRMRDHGKPCISCGRLPEQKVGGTMDCGHYRSVGSASHLRFNTFNAHAQDVGCNRYLSGNVSEYRVGLIARIGINRVEQLESDNTPRSFDIDYLKRVKRIFTKRARMYEKRRVARG